MVPDLDPAVLGDHLDRLYRAAWALCGSREDAEDLVQETYVRVLAKNRVIADDDAALGYLLQVLRNTFVSQLRTRDRRPSTVSDEGFETPATRGGPQAAAEAREVFAAIAALPDGLRDAIVAVDVVGLSYGEAAKALDVPAGTIMSRLSRGRARVAGAIS
jgi:RNA polymerase sigma-70 factor (ECF subfamily)